MSPFSNPKTSQSMKNWFITVLGDLFWINKNREQLIEKYGGKVVGVYNGRVVICRNTKAEILVEAKNIKLPCTPIIWHVPIH